MSFDKLTKRRFALFFLIGGIFACMVFILDSAPDALSAQDSSGNNIHFVWLPLITKDGEDSGLYKSPLSEPLVVTVDLRTMEPEPPDPTKFVPEGEPFLAGQSPVREPLSDPVIQLGAVGGAALDAGPPGMISDPDVNQPGIVSIAGPPDTVGDVGINYFIQMVNATQFQIFNKSDGSSAAGPFNFRTLWQIAGQVGGICDSAAGDPIVVFDHLANRWLLSQFANPNHMCIAISQTSDPLNANWYLYTFDTVNFPDYPKFGVWPDGYYMSTFECSNNTNPCTGTLILGIYVFDRSNMVLGNAAGFAKFGFMNALGTATVRATRILPADLDGPPPPPGTPNFFVRTIDGQQDPGTFDRIEVWALYADWVNGFFSLGLADTLNPAPFQVMLCDRSGQGAANPNATRDCIPQPDTAQNVDALSNRPMMQLKYRDFGTHASMVFNQTIDVSGSIPFALGFTPANEVAGIRWYELQKSGPNWTIHQQGTYAAQPLGVDEEDELLHRWMGSAAMDKFGNMALGYNVSNDDNDNEVYPGIRYTGRRFDDLPGLLPQGEKAIFTGLNSVLGNNSTVPFDGRYRWGDYSALSIDPVDDCTFWFTTHVAPASGFGNRPTQFASFRFDECSTDLSITKSDSPDPVVAGRQLFYDISVTNNGPQAASGVRVVDTLPAGVSYLADTDSCVEAPAGTLTCDLGNLIAGETSNFTIVTEVAEDVVAMAGGPVVLTNSASVSFDRQDSDPDNDVATTTAVVLDEADLRVSKDCKPDRPVHMGTEAVCTITVENLGPSTARNVVATDTHLSNGTFDFVAISPGSCVITPNPQMGVGVVTCNLGDLAAGAIAVISIPTSAIAAVDINDQVTVSSDTPDPNPGNNQASDAVQVTIVSDLAITMSDTPDPLNSGTTLTYLLTVTNNGPGTAVNVVIEDVLPAGVSIVSVNSTGGACHFGVPGNPLLTTVCNVDSLAPLAPGTMTIVVNVDPGVLNVARNDAKVFSDVYDPDNSNNLASEDTAIEVADLEITKSSDADIYKPSSTVMYTIDVVNHGPADALNVVITDYLPDVKQAIYELDTGGCTKTDLILTCDLGTIPAGSSASFNVYVRIKGNKGDVINQASVTSATFDHDPSNNSSTRIILIQGGL